MQYYRQYILQLEVLFGCGTTSQDVSYFPRFYGMYLQLQTVKSKTCGGECKIIKK